MLGAKTLWKVRHYGTTVAAVKISSSDIPLLLADHQAAPSCEPIFEVEDLKETETALKKRGWEPEGELFELPNGPCFIFKDPSGNRFAIFQDLRPSVTKYFAQKENQEA